MAIDACVRDHINYVRYAIRTVVAQAVPLADFARDLSISIGPGPDGPGPYPAELDHLIRTDRRLSITPAIARLAHLFWRDQAHQDTLERLVLPEVIRLGEDTDPPIPPALMPVLSSPGGRPFVPSMGQPGVLFSDARTRHRHGFEQELLKDLLKSGRRDAEGYVVERLLEAQTMNASYSLSLHRLASGKSWYEHEDVPDPRFFPDTPKAMQFQHTIRGRLGAAYASKEAESVIRDVLRRLGSEGLSSCRVRLDHLKAVEIETRGYRGLIRSVRRLGSSPPAITAGCPRRLLSWCGTFLDGLDVIGSYDRLAGRHILQKSPRLLDHDYIWGALKAYAAQNPQV